MTDIVGRLRETALDKDNMPRMDSERWFPVGLAREAAEEIERLQALLEAKTTPGYELLAGTIEKQEAEIERLRAALTEETECARQTDEMLAKTEADNERLRALL